MSDNKKDIKKLNIEQLKELSEEIREKILIATQKNGGHLASNLGIVETIVALYYTFDFPKDKLVFDVGHQCYAHKILSGREDISSIRTTGGLSGFPDKNESEYDTFTSGHAGSSISQGLGLAYARDKLHEDYYVIDVVGDSALVNGVNLEALFSSNVKPAKHIIILNDNGYGISENKNGLYRRISKNTIKKGYLNSKRFIKKVFGNSIIARGLRRVRNFIRNTLSRNNYFENHGLKYVGVLDGNDIGELVTMLSRVKEIAKYRAVLVHVNTQKGKGYEKAEQNVNLYHGVGKNYDLISGSFARALGSKLNEIIDNDERVVAITAGMADGTGLSAVEEVHPKNFIDVGIAEEFAITYASGMARGNLKPVVAIYSTFMQRAYDQIASDVCLQNLPVVMCIDRAGLVGADGKTHQGVFDISYLSHLPNLTILAPNTVEELGDMLDYALKLNSPVAIRYPKDAIDGEFVKIEDSLWTTLVKGDKVNLIAVGPKMLELALGVSKQVEGVGVISARSIKPLDQKVLDQIQDTKIITLEENVVSGGFGQAVKNYFAKKSVNADVNILGVKEEFIEHGSIESQLKYNDFTIENIKKIIS